MRTKDEIGEKQLKLFTDNPDVGLDAQVIGSILMHIQEALIGILEKILGLLFSKNPKIKFLLPKSQTQIYSRSYPSP